MKHTLTRITDFYSILHPDLQFPPRSVSVAGAGRAENTL